MSNFGYDTYYTVDDKIFYSKIAAIHETKGDIGRINFHWMENTWDNVDWTIEPKQSWQELLRIRCQQIRDKYKWVALWYSSGYDSHTILRSFVDNKIPIDELLIYDRRDWFDDPEIPFAIAHANHIKNTYYPNLKINVVRTSFKSLQEFYKSKGEDWIFGPYYSMKISKTQRHFATTEVTDFLSSFGNTIQHRGNVMGIDKPKMILRDNKWYNFCPDSVGETSVGQTQENFYWSSDLPELHIKQCYMVINWFETLQNLDEELVHEIQGKEREKSRLHDSYYEDWNLGMGRFPLFHSHSVSVNGKMKIFHTNSEKSLDSINCLNYIKNNDNKAYKIYTQGLQNARLYNTVGNDLASKTLISKQYYIRDRKVQAL